MKRKKEFSKIVAVLSWGTAMFFTISLVVLVYLDKEISSLSNVILASWAEVAATNSFYYWKAKAENMKKLGLHSDDGA
jgi:hypothetical protein